MHPRGPDQPGNIAQTAPLMNCVSIYHRRVNGSRGPRPEGHKRRRGSCGSGAEGRRALRACAGDKRTHDQMNGGTCTLMQPREGLSRGRATGKAPLCPGAEERPAAGDATCPEDAGTLMDT